MSGRFRFVFALMLSLALVAAACAEDPDEANGGATPTGGESPEALPGEGFHACYVSDTGGVDDRSFNQTIHEGFLRAQEELGIEYSFVESQTAADYAPNLQAFVQQDCDLITPAGFNLGPVTVEAATANPDQLFAIVDYDIFDFSKDPPEDQTFENVSELTFQTDQAAFLAGYLSAGMTETGTIATYGGVLFPTVTIFMNGLSAGVRAYNEDNGTSVEVLGWDPEAQEGTQVSTDPAVGFDNSAEGRRITEDFIAEGADIILPVAGPTGLGTVAAAEDAGNVKVLWVDSDGCVSVPDSCALFLTSVKKNMDVAVYDTVVSVIEDRFEGGLYVGTLENEGVDIAEFHEFEGDVPQELKDRIEELRQGIIAGEVSVVPTDYPA
ncbi:MAG: BMP family ABC transporter substrate-binding protein [Actinobacteria bacterium]|nr:BMP family ABC transporter substrate-binding protein [Actinomycetota bacterium]